jgi:hypothetical protein
VAVMLVSLFRGLHNQEQGWQKAISQFFCGWCQRMEGVVFEFDYDY